MRQSWALFSSEVSEKNVSDIINIGRQNLERAKTFNDADGSVRKSYVSFLNDQFDLQNFLFNYVDRVNQESFNVSLYNKANIQYTEYHGSEGGHYNWHHDVDWTRDDGLDRKLSITVQLSDPKDYTGGEFEFSEVENIPSHYKAKGSIIVFPSYLQHTVKPVTAGLRRSLVAWFEGPRWS